MGIVIGHGGRIVIRLPYAPQAAADRERSWPLDARLAMFVLEAQASEPFSESSEDDDGADGAGDAGDAAKPNLPHQTKRRHDDRHACRFEAALLYPAPAPANSLSQTRDDSTIVALATTAYVRDLSPGHAGFICREPLEAGQVCWLRLDQADGSTVTLRGVVGRCRPFMEGWSEGVVRFATEADEQLARSANTEEEHLLRVAV
jgi:hypothetical protein